MKIVGIMCVDEHAEKARKLLKEAKVPAFSELDIMGFKLSENDSSENWFADKHSMDNSHLFFVMCDENKANELLDAFQDCRKQLEHEHVHAFILNVEKFIQ